MTTKITEKPVTLVSTYRSVDGYNLGLHQGKKRDVAIAWASNGNEFYTVPAKLAESVFERASQVITLSEVRSRIDSVIVYIGSRGATSGFEYVRRLKESKPELEVSLVACGCEHGSKISFSRWYKTPITWTGCDDVEKTLGELVDKLLR